MTKNSNFAIVITAAGSSTRMGSGIKKEYLPLNNGTVLSNCAITFLKAFNSFIPQDSVLQLVITHPAGGLEQAKEAVFCHKELSDLLEAGQGNCNVNLSFVPGGSSRQSSVFEALKFLNQLSVKPDFVLIHDGARPFVTNQIITDSVEAALTYGASVPGVTPIDTQKEIDEQGFIIRHLVRSNLTAVQTPQVFRFGELYKAHEQAEVDGIEYTDDTEIWGKYVGPVKVVPGDVCNKKITYPGDL